MILIKGQCLRFFLWVYLKNILFVPNSASSPLFYLAFLNSFFTYTLSSEFYYLTLSLKNSYTKRSEGMKG